MNSRKYQRRSRNWNSGRLTQPSHQPASDGCNLPSTGTPYQLATSSADLRPPDESHADDVDERDQQHLRRDRVAQAHRRGDGRVELRPRRVRDQAALEELLHHRPHPLVNDQFRHDQQRQRQQQAHVQLHVVEERQLDARRPRRALPRPTTAAAAPRPAASARRRGGAATAARLRPGASAARADTAARRGPARSRAAPSGAVRRRWGLACSSSDTHAGPGHCVGSAPRYLPLPCGLVTASITRSRLKLPGFMRGGNSRKLCSHCPT